MTWRIFLAFVAVLIFGMVERSIAGTETRGIIGKYGVIEGQRAYCLVYDPCCICVVVRIGENPSNPHYPDEVQLYDGGGMTFQSACRFLGTNPEESEAYLQLP